jgi:hypothetical protein
MICIQGSFTWLAHLPCGKLIENNAERKTFWLHFKKTCFFHPRFFFFWFHHPRKAKLRPAFLWPCTPLPMIAV